MLEHAELLARRLHASQTDKAGRPYIEHLAAVAAGVSEDGGTEFEVALGWLHDAKEDTPVSDEALIDIVGVEGLALLTVLTHGKDEPYADYLTRVVQHPSAVRVKLADLRHNSNPARLAVLPQEQRERLEKKYAAAMAQLKAGA